jgi:hypothetical protein
MDWIFTQTKMNGQGRLELALGLETNKKERLTIGYFSNIWF